MQTIHFSTDLKIDESEFASFRSKSDGVKTGLPPLAYTSEAFWQRESKTVFGDTWTFAAFAHEMKKPGDVIPITVGGAPLILVRNRDGSINAFHNVCSHRCVRLVDEPKNVGMMITCPYHGWAYGLGGELRSTPYFGGGEARSVPEGFKAEDYGLKSVQCEVWFDWIFVNVNNNAQPFDEFLAPIKELLGDLSFDETRLVGVIDLGVVQTNWKFLIENFIEPYHVPFVHATTTEQPLSDHYMISNGKCQGTAVDVKSEGGDGSGNRLAVSSRYLSLFPNFVMGKYFPNQIGVHLNTPLGPNKTHQRRAIYMTDGSDLSQQDAEKLKKLWKDVHIEDHEICVKLQTGRESPAASGGALSPQWESSVRNFQEMVLDATSSIATP